MINQLLAGAMVLGALSNSNVMSRPDISGEYFGQYGQYPNNENYYNFKQYYIEAYGSNYQYNTFIAEIDLHYMQLEDFYFGCYVSQNDYIGQTIDYNNFKTNVIDNIEYSAVAVDNVVTASDTQYLTLSYTFDNVVSYHEYYVYFVVYWNAGDHPQNYIDEFYTLTCTYVNTNDNYAQGYSNGLTDGRQQGYDNGYQVGYQEGETTGNIQGYQEGFSNGKSQGYNEGVASVTSTNATIMGLFGAIANVPITILNSVMGPTLLGIPLVTILLNFLSVLLILWLIKKLIR